MNKYKCGVLLILLSILPAAAFAATWTPFDDISSNHFYYTSGSNVTVFTMSTAFSTCSNSNTGNLKSAEVGEEAYKLINSVFITALASNRQVALYYDGCSGTRAKVIGIRLGD